MRTELQRIHAETKMTIVYVTHDQLEAISLATSVVVMKDGKLQQVEEPLKLYQYPKNIFVADFVGSPPINMLPGKIVAQKEDWKVQCGNWLLSLEKLGYGDIAVKNGQEIMVGIRCGDVLLNRQDDGKKMSMTVYSNQPTGSDTFVRLQHKDLLLTAKLPEPEIIPLDTDVGVDFRPGRVILFDVATGERISGGSSLLDVSLVS